MADKKDEPDYGAGVVDTRGVTHLDPEVYGDFGAIIEPAANPYAAIQEATRRGDEQRNRLAQDAREKAIREKTAREASERAAQRAAEDKEERKQERVRVVAEIRKAYFAANAWATDEDFKRALPQLLDAYAQEQMKARQEAEMRSGIYGIVGGRSF